MEGLLEERDELDTPMRIICSYSEESVEEAWVRAMMKIVFEEVGRVTRAACLATN